jgi:alpha-glucosidase
MTRALRFWLDRGVDGFRLDAIDRLFKDPHLRDDPPATEPFALPLHEEYAALRHVNSLNAPDIGAALRTIREAVGDAFLVGEAYLPTDQLRPYVQTLDVVFGFEAMNAGPDAGLLRTAIARAYELGKVGWVLSNHDFTRFATRFGEKLRAGSLLFLTLPGPLFLLQGDELGMPDGPGIDPPLDRAGRDRFRHPMQWDRSRSGGFTTGTPWLPLVDPEARNVADQEGDAQSLLALFKRVLRLRPTLGRELRVRDSPPGTVVLERGEHIVAVNLGDRAVPLAQDGELLLEAHPGDGADPDSLPSGGGWISVR